MSPSPPTAPAPFAASITIERSTLEVYALVSDVTRTGEWSPICESCWWDDGGGPSVGSWFTGRNVTPARTWETRSLVSEAEPGRRFTWLVGGSWVEWSYRLTPLPTPEGEHTDLEEYWRVLPDGVNRFVERYGDDAGAELADRTRAAHAGIPLTLATMKRIAEEA